MDRNPRLAAQQRVWFRCRKHLPDDPVLHICALAYMSDLTLLSSSKVPHRDTVLQTASLDHALWFLRPFRADEWMLYDETSPVGRVRARVDAGPDLQPGRNHGGCGGARGAYPH